MEKVINQLSPIVQESIDPKRTAEKIIQFSTEALQNEEDVIQHSNNNEDNTIAKPINQEETEELAEDIEPPSKKIKLAEVKPRVSPKKRLGIPKAKSTETFIYGNYSRYYGYRNIKDFHDIRLDVFAEHKELFKKKEVLDIGCNCGLLTMEIAKNFEVKNISAIDIDRSLINRAVKYIQKERKNFTGTDKTVFPFNIRFVHGNYILKDDVLLEIESEQFDVILCLSVTKWMHLNFGDCGIKQAFKRMYLQLLPGGKLILEAQPWISYKRRKKLTPEIFNNYQAIKFQPKDFKEYLLGPEVGFSEVYDLGIPDHCAAGFRRPIQVFVKSKKPETVSVESN